MKRASVVLFFMIALMSVGGTLAFAAEAAKPAEEAPAEEAKPYAVGDTIKPIVLKNIEGKEAKVALGNNLTAISFYAFSCSACRQELAFLDKLSKAEPNLKVVAISVDFKQEMVKSFADETKYKMDFYQDPDYKVPQTFGFTSSPAVVLLNKDGKVLFKKMGYMEKDGPEIMKAVKSNL
jgi:thiol-disulfide isomerase/thioredoxin